MVNFEGVKKAILTMSDGVEISFSNDELKHFVMILDNRGKLKGDIIVTDNATQATTHIVYREHVARIAFVYDSTIVGVAAK